MWRLRTLCATSILNTFGRELWDWEVENFVGGDELMCYNLTHIYSKNLHYPLFFMQIEQLNLPLWNDIKLNGDETYLEKLIRILSLDFDFHNHKSDSSSHMFHSFPAKFPPQLPRTIITALTEPGDVVLDPMLGSGTTILEAFLLGRNAIGFDIDPLALLLSKVKVTSLEKNLVSKIENKILKNATI